jgi:FkbM family methyltransferase
MALKEMILQSRLVSPQKVGAFQEASEIGTNGEVDIVQKFITPGDIVFDVGANVGTWAMTVLDKCPRVEMHLFEPLFETYQTLLVNLSRQSSRGRLVPIPLGLGSKESIRTFFRYEDAPSWSTFHRRVRVETECNLRPPKPRSVFTTTLDRYVKQSDLNRIHFLKIDVEGAELEVLKGAEQLLHAGKIDYLQFEYGGTYLDAGTTLREVFEYLQRFRFSLFKIHPNHLEPVPRFQGDIETFAYANFLAVNERLQASLVGQAPRMLDLKKLCGKLEIKPRGVIHIGAHEGKELQRYHDMGVQRVLFIEANPEVFERLRQNVSTHPGITVANCAISDQNGSATLHVTSMDQSSSILNLKRHLKIYPEISEIQQVIVPCKTLDTLVRELNLDAADFNVLNLDIQGAELLALKGATETLRHIDAINTEVNYEELYEGCALIDQVDEFLERHGFERKATTTPYHPWWGDAFYTRKPVICMSSLGLNGRFANQLFQYAFLKIYAREHGLRVETPAWVGQHLFGQSDPPISRHFPEVRQDTHDLSRSRLVGIASPPMKNVDLWGYFQYHARYYAPHKEYFCSLMKPTPAIEGGLLQGLKKLRSKGTFTIGIHLRRGDYVYDRPSDIAPVEWYKDWLRGLWETLDQPVLFLASDEIDRVREDFKEYNPLTSSDLVKPLTEADFYPDFFFLTQCDAVAISNSTFSFVACMLNEHGKFFFRPHFQTRSLIPFDPWNSEPLFRERAELRAPVEPQKEEVMASHRETTNSGREAAGELASPGPAQQKAVELVREGTELLRLDLIGPALLKFNEALLQESVIPDAQYGRAVCLQAMEQYSEAEAAVRAELRLQPLHEAAKHLFHTIRQTQKTSQPGQRPPADPRPSSQTGGSSEPRVECPDAEKLLNQLGVRQGKPSFSAGPQLATQHLSTPIQKAVQDPSCIFLNTYYRGFLDAVYAKGSVLSQTSYEMQKAAIQQEFFGDSDFYSEGLSQSGWTAVDLIVNCAPLQQTWAEENGMPTGCRGEVQIVIEQIRRIRPHVVYLQDLSWASHDFLSAIRPHTDLIVGQIASAVPPQAHLKGLDIIFSSFPHFVERFRGLGIASYYQPLAFDRRVLTAFPVMKRSYPITFVGGLSPAHRKGTEFLERLSEIIPIDFWGYGADTLRPDSPIRSRHRGELWGRDMFLCLIQSRITLNRHIDVAENSANNMRLFEATGCGALLVTDYKDNLNELFEIGREVVAYRSPEECAALLKYYAAHPDEADAIARTGQARTLRDHSYTSRMKQTAEILERRLRYRKEKHRFSPPDLTQISVGYTPIEQAAVPETLTFAWKSAEIPSKQRALVQQEFERMYRGNIPTVYRVLADCLRQHVFPGCTILEVGCASGYYYEVLEYLLNQRIRYTGVDYSEPLIAMARDYYPAPHFCLADGAQMPFGRNNFDIVISSCVLLHVLNTREHIREAARVARLYVVCHRTPVCRQRRTQYQKKVGYGVEMVELLFNEVDLLADFAAEGLELLQKHEYNAASGEDRFEITYLFGKLNPASG